MNLGRKVLHRLVIGYKMKKMNESFGQSAAQGVSMMFQPREVIDEGQNAQTTVVAVPQQQSVQHVQQTVPQQIQPAQAAYLVQPGYPATQVIERATIEVSNLDHEKELELLKEGFDIPEFDARHIKVMKPKGEVNRTKKISYPLIPSKPAKDEQVMAYANIFFDSKLNRYVYDIVEPKITDQIKDLMVKIKELLEEKLDVDFSKLKIVEAGDYLIKQIDQIINYYDFRISEVEKKILDYYIKRDFIGLGKIEAMMHDEKIEDISCDGIGIPIFIFHRDQDLGSVQTNIAFESEEELDSFITRLAQLTGKSVSITDPLVDGTLPDGSRLQATLATDIARKGSNFTIRKFSEEPITPVHLLNYGSVDAKSLAYLWMAVDYGRSILVSGGTASGKTSFLNALSLFIRPDKKIVSIEDTAELRLPHPHWIPTVSRTSVSVGQKGEIDMFMLLKESLRQRPDYIIVGEVRGQEASVLFQQMATGHPSLATIHAENMDKLVDRLTTPPISLPHSLVGSLDLIVFMLRMRYKEKFVRRVSEVLEVGAFNPNANKPMTNQVFKWNPTNDKVEVTNKSGLLKKISDATGLTKEEILDEIERRMLVLTWMQERNITNYTDIYKILNMYYYYPNRVLAAITSEA